MDEIGVLAGRRVPRVPEVSMPASTAFDVPTSLPRTSDLRPALRRLARAALRYAEAKGSTWRDQVKGVAEPAGATDRAVVEGLDAWVADGNPATAALRGAWVGADGKNKAAIVAVLLLAAVLAPLLLHLILLGLRVTSLALKARASTGLHHCV